MSENLDTWIAQMATKYSIPIELLKAICHVESSMNPWAIRYEPDYRWLYDGNGTIKLTITETISQKTSFGLCQIMGAVARELGFMGRFLTQLCDPPVGLEYGSKHLASMYKRYGVWDDAIAAYNTGSARHALDGKYVNQEYVDRVKLYWQGLEA